MSENDNRIIIKLRDLPENIKYRLEGLFTHNSTFGCYFGLKIGTDKFAFVSEGEVAYYDIMDFFKLSGNNDFEEKNKSIQKIFANGEIYFFVSHGINKGTLKNYTSLRFLAYI